MDNISALKRQAERLLAKMEGKRYVIGDLNTRLQTAADENPHDTVIQAMARVVEQMCHKNPEKIISQAEVETLFNELIGLNVTGTKFREVLGDLLVSEKPASIETNPDFIKATRDDPQEGTVDYVIDSEVKDGFDQLFGPISDKYDPQIATVAKEKVNLELGSLGFGNPRVRLAGGNSRYLVFTADLDSNRGAVRIFVPTEASGEKLPSTFVAGNKLETLNAANIKNYVNATSYRNDRLPTVSAILQTLDVLTGYGQKSVEQDDFAKLSSKLPDNNGSEGISSPGTFASMPDDSKTMRDIEIPPTPTPEPLKALTSEIEENVVEASVGYPQMAVRLAKRIVLAELTSMGFKGSQVRISAPTQDGFICEATVNSPNGKVNIEIPIEMQGNAPLMPSVFAKDDFIADFNAANLQAFVTRADVSSYGYVETGSQLYAMSLPELKDVVIRAAANGNFEACNEAMEVISERVDEDTYRGVVADYLKILSNIESAQKSLKQAHEDSDQFVKTPNSIYPVHKRLGRPAHELVRDENGDYHLKSNHMARKENDHAGAFFSTAKVLVGD